MEAVWRKASGVILLAGLLLASTPAHSQLACLLPGLLTGITNSISCGPNASFNGENSAAFGGSSSANANAVALGANSVASVSAVAVGYMASASASGSVAIGNGSVANVANTVSFGSVGNERKLVNIAAGTLSSSSTDAVNGSQLFTTNSTITTLSNQITSGGIGLVTQDATTRQIAVGKATNGTVVDFTGTAGTRKLTGLQAGTLSSSSTDAVNGSQLFTTNAAVTANTSSITTLGNNSLTLNQRLAAIFGGGAALDGNNIVTVPSFVIQGTAYNSVGGAFGAVDTKLTSTDTALTNLSNQITSGSLGLVTQDATTRQIAVGKTTDGTLVDFTGTAGTRKLTGLQAGTLSSSSTDAVNGSQLFTTNAAVTANTSSITTLGNNSLTLNQRLATIFGGGATLDGNNIVTVPSFVIQGTAFNNVGGAFGAVDSKLTSTDTALSNLSNQITSGSLGLVTQDATTRQIAVGGATDGTLVDVTGSAGARKLTGLLRGTISASSTDAVNGAQLSETNNSVSLNTASIATLGANATTLNQRLVSIIGAGASVDANGILTFPSFNIQGNNYTSIGGAFGAVDSKLTSTDTAIANISAQIGNGSIGLVTQDPATRQIAVGKTTDGTVVDFTGTAGTRKLTGLQAATLSSSSTDAVNGAQLFATNTAVSTNTSAIDSLGTNANTLNQRLASVFGGGASIDANGVLTAPSFVVLGSSYNNVNGALNALSSRVQTNSDNISALQASSGGGGGATFVTQNPATRVLNVGATTDGTSVNFSGNSGDRQLIGVAAGTVSAASTDAVNGSQLYATNQAVAATASYATNAATGIAAAIGGGASVDANGNVTDPQFSVQGQTYSTVATAVGAIDAQLSSQATTINSVVTNLNNVTQAQRYVRVNGTGPDASASGGNAVAVGVNANSSATNAIAIGTDSVASQTGALAIGTTSQATGVNAIAIGTNAVATGSVAVGVNALASNGGAAFGDNAVATGANSTAIGPGASATAANAVSIGFGSTNTVANTVSVGSPGSERRITNVAAGVNPTDAVNVSQLNDVGSRFTSQLVQLNRRVDSTVGGVAMAMALTGSSLPSDKKFATALNVGTFGGQTAIGVSQYLRLSNSVVFSGGLAFQDNQAGGRAGVMIAW